MSASRLALFHREGELGRIGHILSFWVREWFVAVLASLVVWSSPPSARLPIAGKLAS
jgi:hypothetical protein